MESREYLRAQMDWDRDTRLYLYRRYHLQRYSRILDVGCGTCDIAREIKGYTGAKVWAIDLNPMCDDPGDVEVIIGDVFDHKGRYDAIVFRFFLMWQSDIVGAVRKLSEMLSPGGLILALAEPDYGGRLEVPEDINTTQLWISAIRASGGNPHAGRYLPYAFSKAGLTDIEKGLSSRILSSKELIDLFDVLWRELYRTAHEGHIDTSGWDIIKKREREAIESEERYIFTPIFWAAGIKR